MSRKRKKAAESEASPTSEGVPEDILAEGSGPVQAVARVAIATDDQEPDPPVRIRNAKQSSEVADEEVAHAAIEDLRSSAEAVETRPKSRKGKRAKSAEVGESVEAVETGVAESIEEADDSAVEAAAPKSRKRAKLQESGEKTSDAEPRKRGGKRAQPDVAAEDASLEAAGDVDGDAADDGNRESLDATPDVVADESLEATDVEPVEPVEAASKEPVEGDDGDRPASMEAADGIAAAGDSEGVAAEGESESESETEGVAALPTSATELDAHALKQLVEALVFASDKPMTVQKLRQLTRVSDIPRLEQALFELGQDYADRGIVLQQVSGGYQFRTRTQWSQWVQQLIAGRPVRLTRAQLETLAIIAYRQPITRPEIDEIRGVDSSATLKLLMDRQLIRILGKKEEVGRPMLYGTTKEFLDFFSLGELRELPTLREYSELTPESRQVITDKLGDLPDDDGSGSGGPMGEGGMGGDPSGGASDGSGLAAAPEPTAADLIAKYVAELDADSVREENAERDARNARIEEDERMVFDVLDDELDANPHARGSAPEIDATSQDAAADAGASIDKSAEGPARSSAEGDAKSIDKSAEGPARSSAEGDAKSIDAPAAEAEVVADDAAELAEAILAMGLAAEPSPDAASPDAVVAAAQLANAAAELADAILTSPSITDDLAFDLSDAMTASEAAQPDLELHEGSLAELDPFTQERDAAAASIGDAFLGRSLVADHDRIAIALVAADVEAPVDESRDADEVEASEDLDASGSDVVRGVFAGGSGGTVGRGSDGGVGASPAVDLDEWPGGSGGLAAVRASMDPRPQLDEDDSDAPIRNELVDPDADEVDAVPDPVE